MKKFKAVPKSAPPIILAQVKNNAIDLTEMIKSGIIMAENKIAYGLAKENGIDTTGMSPKQVWDALKKKGVTPESVDKDTREKETAKRKELERKYNDGLPIELSKKHYSRKVDSAVMNKYSTVRTRVSKNGSATIKVNDGKNFYIVKINKSDKDFDYEILKVWKIND